MLRHYLERYFEKRGQIFFTKLDQADLISPCQELSNGGLGFVVSLLVCWQMKPLSGLESQSQVNQQSIGIIKKGSKHVNTLLGSQIEFCKV